MQKLQGSRQDKRRTEAEFRRYAPDNVSIYQSRLQLEQNERDIANLENNNKALNYKITQVHAACKSNNQYQIKKFLCENYKPDIKNKIQTNHY